MPWTGFAVFGNWLHHMWPLLPLAAGLLSICILFGCAVTCWIAPSKEEDDLFHREVI